MPIEDDPYLDRTPVRQALGTAYLAVLGAINQGLLRRGVPNANSLTLWIATAAPCGSMWRFVMANGSWRSTSSITLHGAGYYRGLLYKTNIVKDALKAART